MWHPIDASPANRCTAVQGQTLPAHEQQYKASFANLYVLSVQAVAWVCRNKADFCEDVREQYKEMRDEFMAGLEDRKYLTIDQVRNKAYEVTSPQADFVFFQKMLQRTSEPAPELI